MEINDTLKSYQHFCNNLNEKYGKNELIKMAKGIGINVDGLTKYEICKRISDLQITGVSSIKKDEDSDFLKDCYTDHEKKCDRYSSGRPKTTMKFVNNICKEGSYLPVVRYKIYYSTLKTDNSYCGTFYFYEPESENYLNLGNYLLAGSKPEALMRMVTMDSNIIYKYDISKIIPMFDFAQSMIDINNRNNNYFINWVEMWDVFKLVEQKNKSIEQINEIMTPQQFVLKAVFDGYDQILCNIAKEIGIDTIILQKEAGSYRFVTEILDVRDRTESYNSFCSFRSNFFMRKKSLIWYPRYGVVKLNKKGNLSIKKVNYELYDIKDDLYKVDPETGETLIHRIYKNNVLSAVFTPYILALAEMEDPSRKDNDGNSIRSLINIMFNDQQYILNHINNQFNNF